MVVRQHPRLAGDLGRSPMVLILLQRKCRGVKCRGYGVVSSALTATPLCLKSKCRIQALATA